MPYGESLMELSNRDYDNPYKFNGKEMDSQTGLYYYGARYYDPQRSFWLSVDPLVEIAMSPYAYTWNDQVNYTDPSGLFGERIGDPGGPNPHKIYGPKGGTLIEEVVMTRYRPVKGFISGVIIGGGQELYNSLTFKGIRDMIGELGTGFNTIRNLVDPSATSNDIWTPETLCITGDCTKSNPTGNMGPAADIGLGIHTDIENDDYHHLGKTVGGGIVALSMILIAPEGEGSGNGFKSSGRLGELQGSGPAPGILEVSERVKSVAQFKNYFPKQGMIEFVFDSETNTFVVGKPHGRQGAVSPHQSLVLSIYNEKGNYVGGMFKREGNIIKTDEYSGHYGHKWNDKIRGQFIKYMEQKTGLKVEHTSWK